MSEHKGDLSFQVAAVIGMAAVWQSFFNQLLYPVSLTFNRTHDTRVYMFHVVYSVLLITVIVALALARKRIDRTVLANGKIVAFVGVLGFVGIIFTSQLDFSSTLNMAGLGMGVGLVAIYAPIHFLFWCMRFSENRAGRANVEMALSIMVFALINGVRLILGIHSFQITLACPLVSSIAAIYITHGKIRQTACVGSMNLKALPWTFILPCLAFIVLCNIGLLLFNSSAQFQSDPPFRPHMYLFTAAFFLFVALLARQEKIPEKKLFVILFSLVSLMLTASTIMATALGENQLNGGSVAFIFADMCLVGFVWILVVNFAGKTHATPTLACSLLLVVVVIGPRFTRACVMYQNNFIPTVENSLQLFLVTSIAALISVAVALSALLLFFWNSEPAPAYDGKPDENVVFDELQEAFELSEREVEIAKLACQNLSAKKMGEQLFIAESTIYTHLKRIYRKTGVHSKQELADLVENLRSKKPLE